MKGSVFGECITDTELYAGPRFISCVESYGSRTEIVQNSPRSV